MDNQKASTLGMNKTGVKMSPKDAVKTAEGAVKLTVPPAGDSFSALASTRIDYMKESEALGTVPMPASPKGMFSALMAKIKQGDHGFIDKLGERIAFERTGTRLYEALLSKYEGSSDKSGYPDISILRQFYNEERQHFLICCEAMEDIGGDATAMTPSADVCGVAAAGWVQAMSDPRINFKQSLEIILQAELVDNDCWDVLIEMATDLGLDDLVTKFERAKEEEEVHLEMVRRWVMEMNLNKGAVELEERDIQ
jgi:hypothetical protein